MPLAPPETPAQKTWLAYTIDVGADSPDVAVGRLIEHALAMQASDVFFTGAAHGVVVQIRQNGIIRPISVLPTEMGKRILGFIKAASSMEFNEKRRPLDGRWIYVTRDRRAIDCRIGVIPTHYGEDVAIRLLSRDSTFFDMNKLGMEQSQLADYNHMIQSPSGLILITGPTGSGKTATIYSTLARLNNGARKINTIEDPIEYLIDGLHQSQVNPMIDLGFAELMRGMLRQNPDVVMLGEIRDEKTAQMAVHAAGTGVLVLATVHSQGTAGAIQTMRSLGCHSHFLASTLRGVLAQRLVRCLCPHCRIALEIDNAPETFEEIRPWLAGDEATVLYDRRGCDQCDGTGYLGRTGVFELMPASSNIRKIVARSKPVNEIYDAAVAEKMLTFRQSALLKVARGETTTDELFRVISAEELMLDE